MGDRGHAFFELLCLETLGCFQFAVLEQAQKVQWNFTPRQWRTPGRPLHRRTTPAQSCARRFELHQV